MAVFREFLLSLFWRHGGRRWIVISGPSVLLGMYSGLVRFPAVQRPINLPKGSVIWEPNRWAWTVTILVGLLVATYLAWREEHDKANKLSINLEKELENLSGCPQVLLGYDRGSQFSSSAFTVTNRGGSDAIAVSIKPQDMGDYRVSSETVHHLLASTNAVPKGLTLFCEPRTNGSHIEGDEAFKLVARTAWSILNPTVSSLDLSNPTDRAKMLSRFVETQNELMTITLIVEYKDLSGRAFESPAKVEWYPFNGAIGQVRPEQIRRLPRNTNETPG
jgi:hypothetical protein